MLTQFHSMGTRGGSVTQSLLQQRRPGRGIVLQWKDHELS
nr:MAG TPA: hypothetical protein [Inoviridae sp.]